MLPYHIDVNSPLIVSTPKVVDIGDDVNMYCYWGNDLNWKIVRWFKRDVQTDVRQLIWTSEGNTEYTNSSQRGPGDEEDMQFSPRIQNTSEISVIGHNFILHNVTAPYERTAFSCEIELPDLTLNYSNEGSFIVRSESFMIVFH